VYEYVYEYGTATPAPLCCRTSLPANKHPRGIRQGCVALPGFLLCSWWGSVLVHVLVHSNLPGAEL